VCSEQQAEITLELPIFNFYSSYMKRPLFPNTAYETNFFFFLFYKLFIFTGGEENGSQDMEAADSLHQHLPHPLIQHHSGQHYILFKGIVS
jgi:hypothetical protein